MVTTNQFTQDRWNLAELFPAHDSKEVQAAFDELEEKLSAFEQIRPQLSPALSSEALLTILEQVDTITRLSSRLGYYSFLWFCEDTQNQQALAFRARVERFLADIANRTLFFSLWWKGLDDAAAERLMADAGDYRYWLQQMRQFKPYTLSEAEERIINIKSITGAHALQTLYDSITNRYTFQLEVDGQVKELSRSDLSVYFHHHDPDLRARAYQELFRVFGNEAPILGQIYQSVVRDWHNEQIDVRHFSSPMAPRNLGNDLPDSVVDTLLDVCQRNAELFQRYFTLKARWLGMQRLRRYDIYAPIGASERHYDFPTASQMVLDSFERFHPTMAELARRVFVEGHLDSVVRRGKESGAFCASPTPDLTPWVLMNYQGLASDVATLAHELGHAVHSMLAANHTALTAHASLPLAETASTFGEMLLVDRMLAEESDEQARQAILFRQVDNAYATIMRQTFFALFERQAHELIHQGASVDQLAAAYIDNLRAQFGEAVELSDEFRWEWVAIWHIFHVPFYVYAYAFGQLLVLSLYQQYRTEGESFKSRYLEILAAGGAASPQEVLSQASIDIHDPGFWQGGFDVIRTLIEQLESLSVDRD